MSLTAHSTQLARILAILGALTVTGVAAQTAPPRTTGDGNRPGGFVTAPLPAPSRPKPIPKPLRAATPPKLLTALVGPEDYPIQLIREGAQGRVGFQVRVSPDGAPLQCEIYQSSGYPMLDAHSCTLVMQRARFEPARDEKGDAVRSQVRLMVAWVIPTD